MATYLFDKNSTSIFSHKKSVPKLHDEGRGDIFRNIV
jgi:hypothetical protein